ncbi:hypothetical protein SUDANB146_03774 [Streptomyces sp. enrichment culture]
MGSSLCCLGGIQRLGVRDGRESVMRLHILPTFGTGSVADVTMARVRS